MTNGNEGPADSSAVEPTQVAEEPAIRKHTNADGLLHVVKGRSYIEPVSGRSPPLSLQQGINGLVGKRKVCKGDIEDLKKWELELGLKMKCFHFKCLYGVAEYTPAT